MYIKENGNIIINYTRINISDQKLMFIIPELILLALSFSLCYITNQIIFILLFIFLGTILFFILWKTIISKKNNKVEKDLIYSALDNIIAKDIDKIDSNIKELDRKYICIIGEENVIRYILVIISNGMIIKYNITEVAETDKVCMLEIDIKYSISNS